MEKSILPFSPEVYAERTQTLVNTMRRSGEVGKILFPAQKLDMSNQYGPVGYPWMGDSNFRYYVGPGEFNSSTLTALEVDIETGERTLYGKTLTDEDITWEGSDRLGVNQWAEILGVKKVLDSTDFKQESFESPYYMYPCNNPAQLVELSIRGFAGNLKQTIEKGFWGGGNPDVIRSAIIEQRIIKTPKEIEYLIKEGDITSEIHQNLIERYFDRPELEAFSESQRQALNRLSKLSFDVISTLQGDVLHNRVRRDVVGKEGDLHLVDFGTQSLYHGYTGDQTSTFPIGKEFLPRQREIYQIVHDAHMHAMSMLKPGMDFKRIHFAAARVMAGGLRELGILAGSLDDIMDSGVYTLFFSHGLGHPIGLDVHDLGEAHEDLSGYPNGGRSTKTGEKSLRFARVLEEGHCVTIEPGIYFVKSLLRKAQIKGEYAGLINYEKALRFAEQVTGIRYEECYSITKNGSKLLGTFRKRNTIEEIEEGRRIAHYFRGEAA